MTRRRTFTIEFKQEAASLVLDQGYSVVQASEAMNVRENVMHRRVKQLREERGGQMSSKNKSLSPEQQCIQELEARLRKVEREKEILKKSVRFFCLSTMLIKNLVTADLHY